MIALAGGHDPLGRPGEDSIRITREDVKSAQPELIIVSPCGYRLDESADLARAMDVDITARVVAVDANSYFARPGPRYAEAIELLAHLFHPDLVPWEHDHIPWKEISPAVTAQPR
jgi:iron complex transport system substrate-binding protein